MFAPALIVDSSSTQPYHSLHPQVNPSTPSSVNDLSSNSAPQRLGHFASSFPHLPIQQQRPAVEYPQHSTGIPGQENESRLAISSPPFNAQAQHSDPNMPSHPAAVVGMRAWRGSGGEGSTDTVVRELASALSPDQARTHSPPSCTTTRTGPVSLDILVKALSLVERERGNIPDPQNHRLRGPSLSSTSLRPQVSPSASSFVNDVSPNSALQRLGPSASPPRHLPMQQHQRIVPPRYSTGVPGQENESRLVTLGSLFNAHAQHSDSNSPSHPTAVVGVGWWRGDGGEGSTDSVIRERASTLSPDQAHTRSPLLRTTSRTVPVSLENLVKALSFIQLECANFPEPGFVAVEYFLDKRVYLRTRDNTRLYRHRYNRFRSQSRCSQGRKRATASGTRASIPCWIRIHKWR